MPVGLCHHPECSNTVICLTVNDMDVCEDHIDWCMALSVAPLKAALKRGEDAYQKDGQNSVGMDLQLRVHDDGERIRMSFNQMIGWFSMSPQDAADLAKELLEASLRQASRQRLRVRFWIPQALRDAPLDSAK